MAQVSQSSVAKCNICSTMNRNISVVCEARCLICIRCQQTPTIRKLFISSPLDCPLCDVPMSRTMVKLVQKFGTLESVMSNNNTFDLDEAPSPYGAFTRRYRSTYPSYGEVMGYELSAQEIKELDSAAKTMGLSSRPASPLSAEALPLAAAGAAGDREAGLGGATSIPTPGPGPAPPTSEMTAFLTSLPAIAQDKTPGPGPGSVANTANGSALDEAADRPKDRAATKEAQPEKTIYAANPAKFTPLMMLDFALECYGMLWQVLARNGNESLASVTLRCCSKKKLSQRSNDFRFMGFLHFFSEGSTAGSREALAAMESSPHIVLFGKCVGLLPRRQKVVRKAWGAVVVSVLAFAHIEKCWRTAELIDAEGNPAPADFKAKLNKLASNKSIPVKRTIRLVLVLGECCQPHWTMAPVLSACQEYKSRTPWAAESVSRLMHLVLFAALWVNGRIAPESGAGGTGQVGAVAEVEGRIDARERRDKERREKEEDPTVVGVKMLKALSAKAKALWSARLHRTDVPVSLDDIVQITPLGTFAFLSPDRAAELAGKMHMGACELALACIEAWEAEYRALHRDMRKALVSTTRRTAIFGSYDSCHASLSRVERLAMLRLLKWHNEMDHLGIDWAGIQTRRRESNMQIYPFHVPASLLDKTVAELNFHTVQVTQEYERDKAREFIEDLVYASGPYAKAPARSPLSRFRPTRDAVRALEGAWGAKDLRDDASWVSGECQDPVLDADQIKVCLSILN